jgi:hypothetical protein
LIPLAVVIALSLEFASFLIICILQGRTGINTNMQAV